MTTTDTGNDDSTGSTLFPMGPLRRSLEHIPTTPPAQALTFCMTNPPFYDVSSDDAAANVMTDPRNGDGRARTPMTSHEGSYPGGEVGFVTDLIVDGLYLHMFQRGNNGRSGRSMEEEEALLQDRPSCVFHHHHRAGRPPCAGKRRRGRCCSTSSRNCWDRRTCVRPSLDRGK